MNASPPIPNAGPTSPHSVDTIRSWLEATDPNDIEALRRKACQMTRHHCGSKVYFRGIIEFSNICTCDCLYCGIRRSNEDVVRYQLSKKEILRQAQWCAAQGYGSVILQSGERRDTRFVDFVTDVVRSIKASTRSIRLPRGLGITLCVGEQSRGAYGRFFDAGAHRYLLRIETSSPDLFRRWHPANQTFEHRRRCLEHLKTIGYQVGTGVMIGAPWQTAADLAEDVVFFKEMDVDMIGMGPYIPHRAAPLGRVDVAPPAIRLQHGLLAIAAVRLALEDVNIAATTALQTLAPLGREMGLGFGANVIMPRVTPSGLRRNYTLYDAKPCDDETDPVFQNRLVSRIEALGRVAGWNQWGDAPHAAKGRCPRSGLNIQ